MTADELKQLIEKDSFLDIAFERFQKFKQSDVYDEEYKFEVLSELNRYFAEITIDGNNIADIARKIQKSNPQSGILFIGVIPLTLLIMLKRIRKRLPDC